LCELRRRPGAVVDPNRLQHFIQRERLMAFVSLALHALRSLPSDRRGVTALEYGLIAAVMGALIVLAFTSFGTSMGTAFTSIGGLLVSKASGM
jgi:pilus assembly protein Flp/PilA